MNSKTKKTILLVEDEPIIALMETEQLQTKGYKVIHVPNGEDAVKFIDEEKAEIDLILMDIDLGSGIDGTETAKIILKENDIPILFLSSHTEPEIVEKTEKISSYGYVVKNSEIAVLDASIKMAFKLYDAKINEIAREEILQVSEAKYKALYEDAPLPYQSLNDEGSFRDVNPAWLKTLGYKRDEVIGKWFGDFLHPNWKEHFKKYFPKFKKRGYINSVQFKIKHKNGEYIDIMFNGCIGYNPDGSFKQTYCVFQDITIPKRINQTLIESEKKYRNLFEKSKDAILIIENGKFVDCNKSTIELLHYKNKEEFLNVHPSELSPENQPDGQNSFIKANEMMDIAIKKGSHRFEWDHKKFNGEIFPVEVLLTTISSNKNNQIIHTVWRDITERKLAEKALRDSEEIYRFLSENMADIVWTVDKDFKTTYVSPSIKKILGFTPEERKKQTLIEMVTPESFKRTIKKYMDEVQREVDPEIDLDRNIYIEVEYYHADGHTIWMGNYTKALRDHTGAVIGLYGTSRNITERKLTESILKESEEKYRSFFDNSPVSLWEEDFFDVMEYLETLKKSGIKNLRSYFVKNPNEIVKCASMVKILNVNQSTLDLYEAKTKKDLIHNLNNVFTEESMSTFIEEIISFSEEPHYSTKEGINKTLTGKKIIVSMMISFHSNYKVLISIIDITEQKKSEEILNKAMEENRVLLKELQHRAKNSFSMISSMIELSADAASSNREKSSLTDIGSRIRAVSEMYDLLYTTDSVTEIRLDDYFNRIISSLLGIPSNIKINNNCEAITISVKTAIPLGMIITELITNSIKYAFPDNRKGIINLSLRRTDFGAVIEKSDNGIGIPEDLDILTIDSMGLKLVQAFTAQIDGSFEIENKNGTQCKIEFPIEDNDSNNG